MKRTLILFTLLFQTLVTSAGSKIIFREIGSLAQAIELAQKEDKLIFIDCSIKGCGHCKLMESTVFTHPNVAPFYNETFINIKINPDSKQWEFMKEEYPLHAYPTYLFIDKTGVLQHMRVGGCSAKALIEAGKKSLDSKANMLFYQKKIESGDHSANTLYNYFEHNKDDKRKDKLLLEFMENASSTELYSKNSWYFLTDGASCYDSIFINFILKNYEKFIPEVGEIEIVQRIEKVMSFYIWGWSKKSQKEKAVKELETKKVPYKKRVIASAFILASADNFEKKPTDKNKDALYKSVNEYSKFEHLNWNKLQSAAFAVSNTFDKHKDISLMKTAIEWADKSIASKKTLTNYYIKAKILDQLGEKEEVIKSINNAIKTALIGETYTANGISLSFLENYLKDLKKDKNAL
ncbi:thioredoxin family protein [Ancylomarina sp. YFZ004]